VYEISGVGAVPVGRVESGTMRPGQGIVFAPAGTVTDVKSIEMHHASLPGDNIGSVVGETARAVRVVHRADDHRQPVFDCHTAHFACRFDTLIQRADRRHGKAVTKAPGWIQKHDATIVKVVPSKPLVVETSQEYAALGRFAVRDMKQTVAVGVVRAVEKKAVEAKKGQVNISQMTFWARADGLRD
jgi:elongation factor 1-alpha